MVGARAGDRLPVLGLKRLRGLTNAASSYGSPFPRPIVVRVREGRTAPWGSEAGGEKASGSRVARSRRVPHSDPCRCVVTRHELRPISRSAKGLRVRRRVIEDRVERFPLVELLPRLDIDVHRNEEIRLKLLIVHFEQLFGGEHGRRPRREAIDQHSVVGLFWCHV